LHFSNFADYFSHFFFLPHDFQFYHEILTVTEVGFALCRQLAFAPGVIYVYLTIRTDNNTTESLWIVMYAAIFSVSVRAYKMIITSLLQLGQTR
jgi:hypothetical protein